MSVKPKFSAGRNVAMKVPPHLWEQTVDFYRNVVGLAEIERTDSTHPTVCFEFGWCRLWIDRVDTVSQSEVWLELRTDDAEAAGRYLSEAGMVRRDEIEDLPENYPGFWIQTPSSIIHLVTEED